LKAVGVNGDREVATSVLQTAGGGTKLRLKADRTVVHADGEDISYITVEAVDGQGKLLLNADAVVKFSITGPGSIAAVGNGDGMSKESYQGDSRTLFHGRALVVVRSSRSAGEIRLLAKAPGLGEEAVTVRSESQAAGDLLP